MVDSRELPHEQYIVEDTDMSESVIQTPGMPGHTLDYEKQFNQPLYLQQSRLSKYSKHHDLEDMPDNEELKLLELRKKKSQGSSIRLQNQLSKSKNNSTSHNQMGSPSGPNPERLSLNAYLQDNQMKESVLSFFKSEGYEGVGQLYFRGLIRLTQFKYLRFVTIIEILGSIMTLLHASVFYYAENELISKETFMIEFEFGYFTFCNLIPMCIMIRQFQISRTIKKFRLAINEDVSSDHMTPNSSIPEGVMTGYGHNQKRQRGAAINKKTGKENGNPKKQEERDEVVRKKFKTVICLLNFWVFIYVIKIIIFISLSSFFLLEINRDDPTYHYLAMTSAVNINFFNCDHHKNMAGKSKITTIQECTNEFILVEWFVFFPFLAFMIHTLFNVIYIKNDIKRNLIVPDYKKFQTLHKQQANQPQYVIEQGPDGKIMRTALK